MTTTDHSSDVLTAYMSSRRWGGTHSALQYWPVNMGFIHALLATALLCIGMSYVTLAQNPGGCSGACWAHDPAVCKRASDGKYFRFSTANKIEIATASSISGPWTIQGSALPSGSKINLPGNQDLWAPDCLLHNGQYYLFYSVSTFGSQNSAIGVATSSTMDVGTWTDHGAVLSSSSGAAYNVIDGNALVGADGRYYLTFGSFWNDIHQLRLHSDLLSTLTGPYQIAFNATGAHAEEGAYIYYRSPYYYLFFSSGICCGLDVNTPATGEEYRINVCRSLAPNGPYVDKNGVSCKDGGGTTVLASHGTVYAPGGQGVFADSSLRGSVIYYHYSEFELLGPFLN